MNKSEKFWNRAAKNYETEADNDNPDFVKIVEKEKKYLLHDDHSLAFG